MSRIMLPEICIKHQSLLIHGAKYKPTDSWQILIIASNIALFQAASCDAKTHENIKDILEISKLGCLACYKPDSFGEIVEAAKSHDIKKIKELGESWVHKANKESSRL